MPLNTVQLETTSASWQNVTVLTILRSPLNGVPPKFVFEKNAGQL